MSSSVQLNINLSFQPLVESVKKWSPQDKLGLNDALWDDNIDIPLEHHGLVLERVRLARETPSRLVAWATDFNSN